jgi:hypothetical protein
VDIVAANAGDSGALLIPVAPPRRGTARRNGDGDAGVAGFGDAGVGDAGVGVAGFGDAGFRDAGVGDAGVGDGDGVGSAGGMRAGWDWGGFTRLTRDHNPEDPLEAKRLTDAGARLGRMRVNGKELGPMRIYPGGLAVSRAIGDFGCPAVTCEPECMRLPLPACGGRLVVASDGLWNAMSDGEVAATAAAAATAAEAADALVRWATDARGLHDDVTVVVVDLPPPSAMLGMSGDVRASGDLRNWTADSRHADAPTPGDVP